jgi:hypothetical protein
LVWHEARDQFSRRLFPAVLADSFGVVLGNATHVPYGTIPGVVQEFGADFATPLAAELPRLPAEVSPRVLRCTK